MGAGRSRAIAPDRPAAYGVALCGAQVRRLLERCGCSVCGCCDRVCDGALGRAHVSDMQPAGGGPHACMTSWESRSVCD